MLFFARKQNVVAIHVLNPQIPNTVHIYITAL